MEIKLNLPTPHPAQAKILKSKAKRVVVNCGRQFGKTSLALQVAIQEMLSTGKYGDQKVPSVLYVTPTNSLGTDVYKEILALLPEEIITEQNATRLYFKLYNGSTFRIISAESGGVAFRGKRHSLCILDEYAFYKDGKALWQYSIEPTMLSYGKAGRAYFISTPVGQNHFHEAFMKAHNYTIGWESFHYTSYDNIYLDRDYIDGLKAELPQLVFEQEILGIFASNQSNPFGNNIQKNVIPELSRKKASVYAADLAKHIDFTVIGALDDNAHLCHLDRFQADWKITKDKIKALPRATDKIIDSTGVGDPIVEDLIYSGVPNIKPFKFNKSSKQILFREFIKAVEEGKIKYTQQVADEMSVFQYTYNPKTGHVDYSAQNGYNDDMTVCVALLWYQYNRRTRRSSNWTMSFL